jgi:hypothetical protein
VTLTSIPTPAIIAGLYSARSAAIGSTRAARRAGR